MVRSPTQKTVTIIFGAEGCALFCFFAVFCLTVLTQSRLKKEIKQAKWHKNELCTPLGA